MTRDKAIDRMLAIIDGVRRRKDLSVSGTLGCLAMRTFPLKRSKTAATNHALCERTIGSGGYGTIGRLNDRYVNGVITKAELRARIAALREP